MDLKEFFKNLNPTPTELKMIKRRTLTEARQEIAQLQKKDKETSDRVASKFEQPKPLDKVFKTEIESEKTFTDLPMYFKRVFDKTYWYYKVYSHEGKVYCDRITIEGFRADYIQSVISCAFESRNEKATEGEWNNAVNLLIYKIQNS